MAAAWDSVASNPDYQALAPDQQEAARQQYFDSVVAPNVPQEHLDMARQQFDAYSAGEKQGAYTTDPVRSAYQATMNNVAKPINSAVGSVVGAATSLIPQNVKQGFSRLGDYLANDDLITSPVYTAAKEGLTEIGENVKDLESYNPDLAHDLPALGENAALAGNMALVKPVSELAGIGLSKTGQSVVASAQEAADAKRAKDIFTIITPKQTPTVAKELGTRSTSEGLNAVRTPQPTDFENKIIDTVTNLTDEKGNPLIKKGQPMHEVYNNLDAANTAEAESLKSKLAAADTANPDNAVIPKAKILATIQQRLAPLRSNAYLAGSNHLDTVFADLASQIPKDGATASQLLDIRKTLDKNIAKYKGESGLDPVRENAFTEAGRIVRQTTNDIIADKYPAADVRASLDKQFHLYNAMDAVASKIPSESPTAIGRMMDKAAPYLPKTVAGKIAGGTALGAAGLVIPGSFALPTAAAGITGYGAYKALTSPAVRKAFGLTLDATGKILRGGKPLAEGEAQQIMKMLPRYTEPKSLPAPDTAYVAPRGPLGGARALTPEESAAGQAQYQDYQNMGLSRDVMDAQNTANIAGYERDNPANNFFNKIGNKPFRINQTALHSKSTGFPRSIFPETEYGMSDGVTPSADAAVTPLEKVMTSAAQSGNTLMRSQLGQVSSWLSQKAKLSGINIDGFNHTVDNFAIRHLRNEHGDPIRETARGQIPLTDDDFLNIPAIIAQPDKVVFGTKTKQGKHQIGYLKKLPDGSSIYLEEVRTGKKELAAQSMRKYPATTNESSILKSLSPNAQSDSGNIIIHDLHKNTSTSHPLKLTITPEDKMAKGGPVKKRNLTAEFLVRAKR